MICLKSLHFSMESRPNDSTSLGMSVNASMASAQELPKCVLKIMEFNKR